MNILFLCNKNPYPEKDGGCLCMNVFIKEAVRRGWYVKVLAVNSKKNFVNVEDIPEEYRENTHYENVFMDMTVKPWSFLATYLNGRSPHITRFISAEYKKRLVEILKETKFDVVRIESIFMMPYIDTVREYSDAIVDLRTHNVENLIWKRLRNAAANPIKKLLYDHVASTLENYELNVIHAPDCISAISEVDAQWFREKLQNKPRFQLHPLDIVKSAGKHPVCVNVVPFGLDIQNIPLYMDIMPEPDSLFYIGAMDWIPNIEGLEWFLSQVWPLVHQKMPQLKFYVAGRNMPQSLIDSHPENVVVVGEVADAHEFMRSKGIMMVPLLAGSGMRVKIIEGLTMSKAIVTTSVGAEGISVTDGHDIVIADKPEEMAASIVRLAENPILVKDIETHAFETAQHYDVRSIFSNWLEFIGRS